MNYIKKIAGKLRGYYVMKGVGLSALAAAVLLGMMIRSGVMTGYGNILFFWGAATAAGIVLGLLVSFLKVRSLKKQIRRQSAGADFHGEHFTKYAKNLYLSRDWMVYGDGVDYRFYNRSSIRRFAVDAKRRGSLVRVLCPEGTEGFPVNMNSAQLKNCLDAWMQNSES